MNIYEAIEKMYTGKKLKSNSGICGNNTSIFSMSKVGIINETYKEGRHNKTEVFSWRRFCELGSNINFEEII